MAELTKEHIPPEGAWKGRSYRVAVLSGEEAITGGRGRVYQRGYYDRVLCIDCNRTTGHLYGKEFARWSHWGFKLLDALRAPPVSRVAMFRGHPAHVAKQVISTMIAASGDRLTLARPDLREYVLDKEAVTAPGAIRLATYLCPTSSGRTTGVAIVQKPPAEPHVLVEFAMPPFGYVLTLEGTPYDARPVDISWFAECKYDEERDVELPYIPVLPTHEVYPGDYRTKDEIRRDVIINTLAGEGHPDPAGEAERILAAGEGPKFFQDLREEW